MHPALLITAISPHVFAAAGPMAEYWGPPSATWRDTGLFLAQNMGILYIGALPFVMLVVGLIKGDFLRREMAFFVAAFIFVTLYALGGYTPAFWLFYEIMPGVDLFRRPADAAYLVGGVGALLAGYALDRRLKSTDAPLTYVQMAAAAALVMAPFIIALGLAVRFDRVAMAATPLLIAAAWIIAAVAVFTLALWLRPIRPALAGLLLVGLTAADLRWNNGPNGSTALPASQFTFLEPSGRDPVMTALGSLVRKATTQTHRPRVELIGLGFHTPNASMTYALENTLGYNPVRLKPYVDATGATDLSGLPDPRPTTPMFPRYNAPLAHLLGLRFIATKTPLETLSPTTPKDFLRLVRRMPEGNIYENPQTLPRVMFATQARNADFTTIVRTGIWPDVDLATTVLLQHFGKDTKIRSPGTARIVTYRNTEVVVETDGPDGGWLVLNDLWHPWWRVEVNGKPAQLLRADVLFRAVAVPPGKASVRFVFRPILGALEGLVRREPSLRSR
jgi:hypothetical protein